MQSTGIVFESLVADAQRSDLDCGELGETSLLRILRVDFRPALIRHQHEPALCQVRFDLSALYRLVPTKPQESYEAQLLIAAGR
jgi:hypothetical protein